MNFDETGVFDAVRLGVRDRKDDAFADVLVRPEDDLNLVADWPGVEYPIRGLEASRAVGSTAMLPSAAMVPVRNVSDDTCPSPTARRLRIKRRLPAGVPDWSGCGTMLGLNSADASNEYSFMK